jgi:RNase H-fold protein (predicted Holliday junction resolvase)
VRVLAIDPGRQKCGLAVVDQQQGCLARLIVDRSQLKEQVLVWLEQWKAEKVLVGGATGSKTVVEELKASLSTCLSVVDEFRTTERARTRYFQDNPPRGWWRLVPLGLQVPPVAIDDYAAVIMGEDYLKAKEKP